MILLHVCCAPCLSRSLAGWRAELGLPADTPAGPPPLPGQGWFANPNIHPLIEFRRRAKAVAVYGQRDPFPVERDLEYGLDFFLDDCAAPGFPPENNRPGGATATNRTSRATVDSRPAAAFASAEPFPSPTETNPAWRRPRRCARCLARRLERAARRAREGGFAAFSSTLCASRELDRELLKQAGDWAARRWGAPFHFRDWRDAEPPERLVKGLYRQSYCGCVFSERDRYENTSRHL